jgi:hypothetical protein
MSNLEAFKIASKPNSFAAISLSLNFTFINLTVLVLC